MKSSDDRTGKTRGAARRVSDSGVGRWPIKASIDDDVPSPVLASALYERLSPRGNADDAGRVRSAMRVAFGDLEEKGP